MTQRIFKRPDLDVVEFEGILTVSPQMRDFFELLRRVGRTDATVLIRGETGTGKELAARAVHRVSRRASGAWKAINCATLTSELLASELFGHIRGAFTGAVRDRPGLFAVADGGTVFLDEVAEISPENQARLLRVLQERSFIPVGATDPVSADVRVVSATNKGLRKLVREGRFREDLMYRIRVVPLFLPRLAEREGDVEALAWSFIDQFNREGYRRVEGIDSEAREALLDYDWPGNIRELRNNIEYAFAVADGPTLTLDQLAPELRGEGTLLTQSALAMSPEAQEERTAIEAALRQARGKKGRAADLLGMSRSTLWRKLREYGLAGYR